MFKMEQKQRLQASLLFYLSKLIFSGYSSSWFILFMCLLYHRISKRKLKYSITVVPDSLIFKYANSKSCFKDINNLIIVNKSNIYNCDNILLLFNERNTAYRFVHVIPSSECKDNEILMSSILSFNLQNAGIENPVQLLGVKAKDKIKFADDVEVSLVKNPWEFNNSLMDTLIQKYFSSPKIVNQDDMIEINIKYFAEDLFYSSDKLSGTEIIYFKCTKLTCDKISCFCVIGETAIRRGLGIQRLIPKKLRKITLHSCRREIPLCPYGLQGYMNNIERAVKPFLKKCTLNLKPVFLLQGPTGSGKELLVATLASYLGMHFYKVQNTELMANVYAQNESKLKNVFFNARNGAPCVMLINNFEHFGKNNEDQYDERLMSNFADELDILFMNNYRPVLLFCSTNSENTPFNLKKHFLETFQIDFPNDSERKENIRWIIEEGGLETDVDLGEVANKTHGFVLEDLRALVYYAEIDAKKRCPSWVIQEDSFHKAIDFMQNNYCESIGAPKVPKVEWSDVGGMGDIKAEIIKTINLPLKHPEFVKKTGLKRSGILLFGPPGTGKTLIAKAVATECGLCFLAVKGPELLNMYVGQSEQNIRDVFQRARVASPCIIFFDELDSLAPNRGMSGDSGGVMDRVVSQLLAEMDGLSQSGTVFIIGATNRPDLIDPALLRPGRFDKLLYVGPCIDTESKLSVLKALTRKFNIEEGTDLRNVVDVCPKNITGADFYGICANAWSTAVRRLIETFELGRRSVDEATSEDVVVNTSDFESAIKNAKPSLATEDLLYFEKLKEELSTNK